MPCAVRAATHVVSAVMITVTTAAASREPAEVRSRMSSESVRVSDVASITTLDVAFADFKSAMESEIQSMGLQAMMMHEDVVNTLHRV